MDSSLHLGLELAGPDDLSAAEWRSAAVSAEERGFGCLWLGGGAHVRPTTPDAATLAGAVAAATSRLSVGVVGTLGPRTAQPSLLARAVTALDHVSGGRAALLIQLGPELERSPERWELLQESVDVCHSLFSREVSTVPGRHYALLEAANRPLPVRPGGLPLLVQLPDTSEHDVDTAPRALRVMAPNVDAFVVTGGPFEVDLARRAIDRAGLAAVGEGGPGVLWRGQLNGGQVTAELEGIVDGQILREDEKAWSEA